MDGRFTIAIPKDDKNDLDSLSYALSAEYRERITNGQLARVAFYHTFGIPSESEELAGLLEKVNEFLKE